MPTNSLADRIRASRKSRSPVQDTVERHFDEISQAIADGSSYRDLYAQMTREGNNVGKAHGSLYAAFKAVEARRKDMQPSASQQASPSAGAEHEVHPAAPAQRGEPPVVISDTRRKTTDWE